MAALITDGDLNVVAKGPDLVIHQPDHVLLAMGDWCREHHGKSGLVDAVKNSTKDVQVRRSRGRKFDLGAYTYKVLMDMYIEMQIMAASSFSLLKVDLVFTHQDAYTSSHAFRLWKTSC